MAQITVKTLTTSINKRVYMLSYVSLKKKKHSCILLAARSSLSAELQEHRKLSSHLTDFS